MVTSCIFIYLFEEERNKDKTGTGRGQETERAFCYLLVHTPMSTVAKPDASQSHNVGDVGDRGPSN